MDCLSTKQHIRKSEKLEEQNMNGNHRYLLSLVNNAIHRKKAPLPDGIINWDEIYMESQVGKLGNIIFSAVKGLPEEQKPSKELMKNWNQTAVSMGVKQLNTYFELGNVLDEAKKKGILMIIFKGPVLAQLYPEYLLRYSCDIDILIDALDKERAENLLLKQGFVKDNLNSKENVPVYFKPGGLVIELHLRLWEDYTGYRVDMLEKMDLTSHDKLIDMKACDLQFTTLGYTEHLIYQMYHIIKHFSFQGMDLRHFTDTALYVNYYKEKIDFLLFWETMEKLGYDVFCGSLFRMCVKYFEMDRDALKYMHTKVNFDEDTLLEEIFNAGMIGSKNLDTRVASAIVYQTCYENDSGKASKWNVWKASIFPKAEDMAFQYKYARKHHWLLPMAWCHRAWNYLGHRLKRKEKNSVKVHMDIAQQKISLLKKLNLLNKED